VAQGVSEAGDVGEARRGEREERDRETERQRESQCVIVPMDVCASGVKH